MKRKFLFILLTMLLLIAGCGKSTDTDDTNESKNADTNLLTKPYERTEFLMGTIVTIKVYDENKEAALEPVFERIQELVEKIDVNDPDKVSEIDQINDQAGIEPVKVSDDIYNLIAKGKDYSTKAEGSYDISIGPLTDLWRIGFPDERKPEQSEIDAVLPFIDYKQVELDDKNKTVFLGKKEMKLDLGSIAKGFMADEAAEVLKENDVTTAIIDLGGNIYVLGNNPSGKQWTVGIQDPYSTRNNTIGKISETDKSIVTSGIYERVLEVDGKTYHHLLSPFDGYPFDNDIAGVSIVSDKSIDGDGLSTSVFSKGVKDGLKFVEQFKGAEAIFISTDKKVYITSGLKGNFELTNEEFEIVE